jgi:hypothetical protein
LIDVIVQQAGVGTVVRAGDGTLLGVTSFDEDQERFGILVMHPTATVIATTFEHESDAVDAIVVRGCQEACHARRKRRRAAR